jgi:uncharacterized membrane protein
MSADQIEIVTKVAAAGTGIMGGLLFAFSACVMRSLGRIADEPALRAMQHVNVTIINPPFGLLFFGTAASCIALVVQRVAGSVPVETIGVVGAGAYLVGFLVMTMVVHVPLNNGLARLDAAAASSGPAWHRYRTRWTALNHVRVVASVAACGLLVGSL